MLQCQCKMVFAVFPGGVSLNRGVFIQGNHWLYLTMKFLFSRYVQQNTLVSVTQHVPHLVFSFCCCCCCCCHPSACFHPCNLLGTPHVKGHKAASFIIHPCLFLPSFHHYLIKPIAQWPTSSTQHFPWGKKRLNIDQYKGQQELEIQSTYIDQILALAMVLHMHTSHLYLVLGLLEAALSHRNIFPVPATPLPISVCSSDQWCVLLGALVQSPACFQVQTIAW